MVLDGHGPGFLVGDKEMRKEYFTMPLNSLLAQIRLQKIQQSIWGEILALKKFTKFLADKHEHTGSEKIWFYFYFVFKNN